MQKLLRALAYLAAFSLPVVTCAGLGYVSGMTAAMGQSASLGAPILGTAAPRPFDPAKPTVAILLGGQLTEVTDFLIPYEIFSAAGAFNVYSVAPERRLTTLTGGLDVLPDYTLAELETLLGRAPDIVVVPAILDEQRRPILDWLQR